VELVVVLGSDFLDSLDRSTHDTNVFRLSFLQHSMAG
jgi:hypothetical protein